MNYALQFVTAHPRECAVITIFGFVMFIISISVFVCSKKYSKEAENCMDAAIARNDESIKAREDAIRNFESASKLVSQYKKLRDECALKLEEAKRKLAESELKKSEAMSMMEESSEILKQSENIRKSVISMIQNSCFDSDTISSSIVNFCKMLIDSVTNTDGGDDNDSK